MRLLSVAGGGVHLLVASLCVFSLSFIVCPVVAGKSTFFLRTKALSCSGLKDGDSSVWDNGRGSDVIISLYVDDVWKAQNHEYIPNNNNPVFSWVTDLIQDVDLGSTLKFKLEDYDPNVDHARQLLGSVSMKLPSDSSAWSKGTYGDRSGLGSPMTKYVTSGTGTCKFSVQFYASICETGEYVDADGRCQKCLVGTYCEKGASMLLCDAGTYAAKEGQKSCEKCPSGKFQSQKGQPGCSLCPAGKYQGKKGQVKCDACDAGHFGVGALARTTSDCDGVCDEGYYCLPGSSSRKQYPCGGVEYFCPKGSSKANTVKPGYYSYPNITGRETTRVSEIPCEAGFSCAHGIKTACLTPSYQNETKQSNCKNCLSSSCPQDNYRKGCGLASSGNCILCSVNFNNFKKPSICPDNTNEYNKCDGSRLYDDSECENCACADTVSYQYKQRQEGKCGTCVACDYTPDNCKGDNYLVNKCVKGAKFPDGTFQNSECKSCLSKCSKGYHVNFDCGGETEATCLKCKSTCANDEYLDPISFCTGKTRNDTTRCLKCSNYTFDTEKYFLPDENCGNGLLSDLVKRSPCIPTVSYKASPDKPRSDRDCKPCKECPHGKFQAASCTVDTNTNCVLWKEPEKGEYVLEPASALRDTLILKISNCSKLGRYQPVNDSMAVQGNSSFAGKDTTCIDYNPCDLKETWIKTKSTSQSDWECREFSDCAEIAKDQGKPTFEIAKQTAYSDRQCGFCTDYTLGQKPSTSVTNFNLTYADKQYRISCLEKVVNEISTAEALAIAGAGFVAFCALMTAGLIYQKKRKLAAEKALAEEDLGRARDDLEIADNMVANPLQQHQQGSFKNDPSAALLAKKDKDIARLRDEVRRLKLRLQKDDSSSRSIEMSHTKRRTTAAKKQFGQLQTIDSAEMGS